MRPRRGRENRGEGAPVRQYRAGGGEESGHRGEVRGRAGSEGAIGGVGGTGVSDAGVGRKMADERCCR